MKVVVLGLSITSSWGNGHATNYRALARALAAGGDEVAFLERETAWYAAHRDLPDPPWCSLRLYDSLAALDAVGAEEVGDADLVIVGSFVPDGVEVANWILATAGGVVAFYDIDTPVTLGKLRRGDTEYLSEDLVGRFDAYLSFTAGPALDVLREEFGARRTEAFYCFVDEQAYAPVEATLRWSLSYLGTYAAGRQPAVDELLLAPAIARPHERFVVAGPMYPDGLRWPPNVERIEHLAPADHAAFYCAGTFTLNLTRPEMRSLGYSPSVRLFEAAACGVPIISDRWLGLDTVFIADKEIFLADSSRDVLAILDGIDPDRAAAVGAAARARVLREHTAERRAQRLRDLVAEVAGEAVR